MNETDHSAASPVSRADVRRPVTARRSRALKGRMRPPGDKSMSHRAFILGLLARGETSIEGLLEGDDVMRTSAACRALGAIVKRVGEGRWTVVGRGLGSLVGPREALDFGNAGTGSRLMMGVVAGHDVTATFDGDASLRKRPMRRVLDPLVLMGAEVLAAAEGGCCPIVLKGTPDPRPVEYTIPVASAQIKSAVLLAGLSAPGATSVIEKEATRDHTEKMLRHFGATVSTESISEHGRRIILEGRPQLVAAPVVVPADPSSAAFPLVAALIVPGSDVLVEGMMMNPLRIGLLATLLEMGADIEITDRRVEGGEEVADLRARASLLRGIEVPAARAPSMIDEYPILAVAAAFARGETRMRGLHELRVKESDRLAAVAAGLKAVGVAQVVEGDDLVVVGTAGASTVGAVKGGATIATNLDHRIAMSFLVMGLASQAPIAIDDEGMIATSFPAFKSEMSKLGAEVS
ncbi:MAG: 3-phosphoshikimate 1-carboxyvinyltransferase [Methylobacteriaceae bacterium]|nr:3-phosphoshikimate 1-carboxyvinyltransferase [Methylobacteriaceae bacterium]